MTLIYTRPRFFLSWEKYRHFVLSCLSAVSTSVCQSPAPACRCLRLDLDSCTDFEVKSSSKWKREFSKNLRVLKDEKKLSRALGVYMGERPLKDECVEVFPVKDFLKKLYKGDIV